MKLTLVTLWLAIANVVMGVLQWYVGDRLMLDLALWPVGERVVGHIGEHVIRAGFQPLQLLSYGFLHSDWIHLTLNMYGLVMFGPLVERCMGTAAFAFYYVFCLLLAGLTQLLANGMGSGVDLPTVGASGAIYGLLAAAASLYPRERRFLVFPPIEIEVRSLALILGGSELLHGVLGSNAGIAHFAHLGGMLGGFVLIQYWRGRLPLKPRRELIP